MSRAATTGPTLAPELSPGHRHLHLVALIALAEVMMLLLAHVAIDPRAEFPGEWIEPVVPDYATEKIERFTALAEAPDLVIMGTSRVILMAPDEVTRTRGESAFNFAIPGGALEAPLATYRWMVARDARPADIILGVDTNQLVAGSLPSYQLRTSKDLGPYLDHPLGWSDHGDALLRGFDTASVRDDLRALKHAVAPGGPPAFVFDDDGRGHFPVLEARWAAEDVDVDEVVRAHVNGLGPGLDGHLEIPDPERQATLDRLVREASEGGTTVHVFLTPLHPVFLAHLEGTTFEDARAQAVAHLARLCQPGVHAYDYLDITAFDGDRDEFYDSWHTTDENGRRIVRALLAGRGDICGAEGP